jgi:NAD(P)-dependent dehydrogenase (short-subunit alcohol dehydrogenase family)
MQDRKVVVITGCSSGFGYLAALKFAREKWTVVATVRDSAEELKEIAKQEQLDLEIMKIDVTQENQVKNGVKKIVAKYRHIDVLVNNAGYGLVGPVEDLSIPEMQEVYNTNVFGTIRMTQAVLPAMRDRHAGRIINISSVNGLLTFGLYGAYSSSKFALEAISEAVRFEIRPFNIQVSVIEPGAFMTKFHENRKVAKNWQTVKSAYSGLKSPLEEGAKNNFMNSWLLKK